jgi:hypothetical protein
MTIHAPSDHRSITIPAERGGCGVPHEADGDHLSVTCALCEPLIAAMGTGWAMNRDSVHLTPDEIGVMEAAERNAARERDRTWGDPKAMAGAFAQAMQSAMGTTPAVPSLMQQIAALTQEERAVLGAMLRDSAAAEPADRTVGNLRALTAGEESGGEQPPTPPRPRGRPRKVTPEA